MQRPPMPMIEPFIERLGATGTILGTTTYRFGYRIENTKDVISAVDISAEAVERALTNSLSLSVRIVPDGHIVSSLIGADGFPLSLAAAPPAAPIDELMAEAVETENLHLEEAGTAELEILLSRLERSISLVKEALDRLKGPG